MLLFAMIASLPQVHAVSVTEKFPTSTTEIVAGWNNATAVYAKDGIYANSTGTGATQEYSGFNFTFTESETVEAVFLKTKYHFNYSLADYVAFQIRVYNGSWRSFYAFYITSGSGVANDHPIECAFDITSIINGNRTLLNNLQVRIKNYGTADGLTIFVDYVGVQVAYSSEDSDSGSAAGPGTPSEENPNSWLMLPTLNEFVTGIQEDLGNLSQILFSLWNDVRYSNYFKLLLVLSLIGVLGLLVRGRKPKKSKPPSWAQS